jgi:spermidine synthase
MTVRLNQEFYRRLKSKLAADGTTFQSKVQALLEEYVDGAPAECEELQRQVAAARVATRRYAPALRDLAR